MQVFLSESYAKNVLSYWFIYFLGVLLEYFDDTKTKVKERYCWIKNGYFCIAKIGKTKPVKSIDLSTVVVLDESDPKESKHAFKLEYTNANDKRSHVLLRALDAALADKWMVAVSMGILYHRLAGAPVLTTTTTGDQQQQEHGDYGFVSLSSESNQVADATMTATTVGKSKPKTHSSARETLLRKEIAEKLGKEDSESYKLVDTILGDEPDGEDTPPALLIVDEKPEYKTRLSHLGDEEDQVFSEEEVTDQTFEVLENIPEKENADEAFRNVKGILRQQESIRRTILKNQREKRVPPPVKPKPSKLILRRPTMTEGTILKKYGPIESLALSKLHAYGEQLESEKGALSKCVRTLTHLISEAVVCEPGSITSENSVTNNELNNLQNELDQLKTRLIGVEKELRACRIHITRKTASKAVGVISPEMRRRPNSVSPVNKSEDEEQESEDGRDVQIRESPGRRDADDEDADSIII
jgi:PH domain.